MYRQIRRTLLLQETGRVLSRLGHWGIPLSIGIVAGYWFSDSEMTFIPMTLGIVTAVLIFSFALLPLGRMLQGTAFVEDAEKRKVRKRVVILTALCLFAVAVRFGIYMLEKPSPLTQLSSTEYSDAFGIDIARYQSLNATLKMVTDFIDDRHSWFIKDGGVLNASAEQEMLQVWQTLYDTAFAMDQVRAFHEDWYRFDPSRLQRNAHVSSFLLMYASEIAMYRTALMATQAIGRNKSVEHFLNSPHPKANLPNNNFSVFKEEVTGYDTLTRILSAGQYLKWLRQTMPLSQIVPATGASILLKNIERDERTLSKCAVYQKAWAGFRADIQPLKRQVRRQWLPAQKRVAQAMGNTRLRRIGKYLITPAQHKTAIGMLRPGDVLLTRKNWYLSNAGLPGFWPHAILYVGTQATLNTYFDTPEVHKWVLEASNGKTRQFTQLLAQRYPDKWRQYTRRNSGDDYYLLIEAIGEGVVFNTLTHSAGDYMAAMRPSVSRLRKALAILQAFEFEGKPYDFNFDFATDHALVCTELVWRSYRPDKSGEGLHINLVEIMGRQTLPANEIAKLYGISRTRSDRQLDFVLFLDASESLGRAWFSDESAFANSWRRSRWDMQLP
ncbi:MAG: hypothetical protein JXX14_01860 [Deltaproteobacteria bacterium]|nr:hypothetical protein [Deltaproteobacteria bacterium]